MNDNTPNDFMSDDDSDIHPAHAHRTLMYCKEVSQMHLYEVGNPFPDDVAYITAAITQATINEVGYKHLLLLHGVHESYLNAEIAALRKVAQSRVKAAMEETDALAVVDYERNREAAMLYLAPDFAPTTTLNIKTELPDMSTEEPFYSQDKHLNEIRGELIAIYVRLNINFYLLTQLEAKGLLYDSAEQVYSTAVDTGNDKLRQELESWCEHTDANRYLKID